VAFVSEIKEIIWALEEFKNNLAKFGKKAENYIEYLNALIEAFKETDSSKTYKKWQKVDEIWMKLQDDIQICHPLEFYEDKYAKAVAPEWDLRVKLDLFNSQVRSNILNLLNYYKKKYS
jgi:hypothetical protein